MDYNKRKDDLASAMANSFWLDLDMDNPYHQKSLVARRWMDAYADIRAALDVLRDLPVLMDWAREHGCKSIGELLALWQLTDNTEEGSLEDYVTFGRPASAAMEAAEAEAPATSAPSAPAAPAGRSYLPGLRACRNAAGISQEKLAKLIGTTYGTLGTWERVEVSVAQEDIDLICAALSCSARDLLSVEVSA